MKIVDVRAAGLFGHTPRGGWTNELSANDSVHTLIAVEASDGTVGFGSSFTSEALVLAALKVLRPLLVGSSGLEPERTSEMLHRMTFWQGRGGAVTHAISGIDIALWDLFGKYTNTSVSRLLGGRWRERVRPYASVLMDEPPQMADIIQQVRELGFQSVKIGWGPFARVDAATDEAIVRAARSTLGDDGELMVDAGASDGAWHNDLRWAVRTSEMLESYGVIWFEEALRPDALDEFAELRARSRVAISGGEVLTRRQSFTPWLQRRAWDIVQPDVTKVGGLSEVRRIGWMAEDYGIRLIPHGWNTGFGLAADLQLAAALPQTDRVEYICGSRYVDDIILHGWHIESDGMMQIPDGPGLGVGTRRELLEPFIEDARTFLGAAA